jgi:hypothetical protein
MDKYKPINQFNLGIIDKNSSFFILILILYFKIKKSNFIFFYKLNNF